MAAKQVQQEDTAHRAVDVVLCLLSLVLGCVASLACGRRQVVPGRVEVILCAFWLGLQALGDGRAGRVRKQKIMTQVSQQVPVRTGGDRISFWWHWAVEPPRASDRLSLCDAAWCSSITHVKTLRVAESKLASPQLLQIRSRGPSGPRRCENARQSINGAGYGAVDVGDHKLTRASPAAFAASPTALLTAAAASATVACTLSSVDMLEVAFARSYGML